ncbi:hypothetical protein Cantr_07404 [Candida viswanathii]|uniref:Uncharacterized protein n=1 Tax=Candida viswanathii TaxID=5486 RepID=A0A367Y055_9ASCO|nr:hypothetical protein Cantr_07404 [Candida viswanathii]
MDLSNLSNTLPSTNTTAPNTSTASASSQANLNHELTNHFKDAAKSVAALYNSSLSSHNNKNDKVIKSEFANAAKSVASLYKLSQSSQQTAHSKGYLQCLDDILSVLANDEDVEDWVLTKRIALLNQTNARSQSAGDSHNLQPQQPVLSDSEEFSIPQDYEFNFSLDVRPPSSFRASISPISVQHSQKQRVAVNNPHSRHNKKFIIPDDAIIEDLSESEEKELRQQQQHKLFSDIPLKKKKKLN